MFARGPTRLTGFAFCCAVAAQDPERAETPTPPTPPVTTTARTDTALQRAAHDAATACRALADATLAYSGTCQMTTRMAGRVPAEELAFTGAQKDGLRSFRLGDHHTLQHGDHILVSNGGGAFSRPQGDAPDCPFAPDVLAKHFDTGTVDAFVPTDFGGRPALRVHVVWTGNPAVALLRDLNHPSSRGATLLEALARRAEQTLQNPDTTMEASVWFDPATKSAYAATLRFAFCPDRAGRDGPLPKPKVDADGLADLAFTPFLTCVWRTKIETFAPESLPTLDAEMRGALQWPRNERTKASDAPAVK